MDPYNDSIYYWMLFGTILNQYYRCLKLLFWILKIVLNHFKHPKKPFKTSKKTFKTLQFIWFQNTKTKMNFTEFNLNSIKLHFRLNWMFHFIHFILSSSLTFFHTLDSSKTLASYKTVSSCKSETTKKTSWRLDWTDMTIFLSRFYIKRIYIISISSTEKKTSRNWTRWRRRWKE